MIALTILAIHFPDYLLDRVPMVALPEIIRRFGV